LGQIQILSVQTLRTHKRLRDVLNVETQLVFGVLTPLYLLLMFLHLHLSRIIVVSNLAVIAGNVAVRINQIDFIVRRL
jgi:hypothetical protein